MKAKIIIFLLAVLSIPQYLSAQTAALEATLNLKTIDGLKIPFQNGIPVPSFEMQTRDIISLSGEWKKERFSADDNITLAERNSGYADLLTEAADRYKSEFDDSAWETKTLPAVENEMYAFPTVPEYYEDGIWYRKTFTVDSQFANKILKLKIYAINYVADIWINGEYAGYHEGGYTPFAFDITDKIIPGQENTIAIRVDNPAWGSRKDIVPFYRCDWFNYAGVIHDIYIEATEPISVVRADVVPLSVDGLISTQVLLENKYDIPTNADVQIEVFNADVNSENIQSEKASDLIGTPASITGNSSNQINLPADSIAVWKTELTVNSPKLWSPAEPNLYILSVTVRVDNQIKDQFYTQFGIRTIETSGDKVKLNNHVVFFTGAARHEDHPDYGRAVPKDIIFSDLQTIKESNINFLRTGHYPNNLYTYLIADRIGLAVMEEIPVWWFDTAEPWLIQNEQRHIHEQMFREMVFKDYNRPSIILWSTSNECKESENRLIYNERIKNDITENYYDGRLVSQSSAGDNPGYADTTQTPLDVAGWTLYFGIFHGSTYFNGTLSFLSNAKNSFPGKPIIDTEFGYWSGESGSTLAKQQTVFDETFNALKFFSPLNTNGTLNSNGILMATTWWCVFDWYSHQHPTGYQSMGLISMDRQTYKPVYTNLKNGYEPYFKNGGLVLTGINESAETAIPKKYILSQNYPNPFNPSTTIKFEMPKDGFVELKIYNFLGQEISTLINNTMSAGNHSVEFNSSLNGTTVLSSGVYFYSLYVDGKFISVKKMILLR